MTRYSHWESSFSFSAAAISLKIEYAPAKWNFKLPRNKLFVVFALLTVLFGFSDVTLIAYPLFLHQLTGSFFDMGVLTSAWPRYSRAYLSPPGGYRG